MTRGKFVLYLKDRILISNEFNGDMYWDGYGVEAYKAMRRVFSVEEFENKVREFNRRWFHYDEDEIQIIEREYVENKNGTQFNMLDMDHDYFKKYFSDYLYVKNMSDNNLEFILRKHYSSAGDSKPQTAILSVGKCGVFNFGGIASDCPAGLNALNAEWTEEKEKEETAKLPKDDIRGSGFTINDPAKLLGISEVEYEMFRNLYEMTKTHGRYRERETDHIILIRAAIDFTKKYPGLWKEEYEYRDKIEKKVSESFSF